MSLFGWRYAWVTALKSTFDILLQHKSPRPITHPQNTNKWTLGLGQVLENKNFLYRICGWRFTSDMCLYLWYASKASKTVQKFTYQTYYFFGNTGICTQGLMLARQSSYLLSCSSSPHFCDFIFL
jgi:hypothetical protein